MYLSRTLTALLGLVSLTSAGVFLFLTRPWIEPRAANTRTAPAAVEQRDIVPFEGERGPGVLKQRPKPQKAPALAQGAATDTTTTYTTVTIPGTETTGVAAAAADADATASSEPLILVAGDNDGSVITVAPASPATTSVT